MKYRKKVFDDDMSNYAKDMFVRLSEKYNITLGEWNQDVDFIKKRTSFLDVLFRK